MTEMSPRYALNSTLQSASISLLGPAENRALSDYHFDGRYHRYKFVGDVRVEDFTANAKAIMATVSTNLEVYLGELLARLQDNNLNFTGGIGDLSWLLGYGDGLYIEAQIAAPPPRYVLAQPALMLLRNVDTAPLHLCRCRFQTPFEAGRDLDLATYESLTIEQGEDILVNGFDEVVWAQSAGQLFLRVATLSLGAYDALFDVKRGRASGVFSTDVRASYLQTALRLLGAAKSPQGRDMAAFAATSPLKELRWSALNYYWRFGGTRARDQIAAFEQDPQPQMRVLAAQALRRLSAQELN